MIVTCRNIVPRVNIDQPLSPWFTGGTGWSVGWALTLGVPDGVAVVGAALGEALTAGVAEGDELGARPSTVTGTLLACANSIQASMGYNASAPSFCW